jgi:WD40 repeat protein
MMLVHLLPTHNLHMLLLHSNLQPTKLNITQMSFPSFGGAAAVGGISTLSDGLCSTPGTPDSISKLAWTKNSNQFIAASNWDGQVRLYQQQQSGFGFVAAAAPHNNAPVLCVDWHAHGDALFTCGGDNMATRCALAAGAIQPTPVAKHDAPIKAMTWWSDINLLVVFPASCLRIARYLFDSCCTRSRAASMTR